MSVFDALFRRGPVEDPFTGGQPDTLEPEPEDPLPSFLAMEDDLQRTTMSQEVGAPILPCERPSMELSLFDADGRPLANVPYSLWIPGASGLSGSLDERGFARIEDVTVDASTAKVEVEVERDDEGEILRYLLRVIPSAPGSRTEDDPEDELTAEAPLVRVDFDTPWKLG